MAPKGVIGINYARVRLNFASQIDLPIRSFVCYKISWYQTGEMAGNESVDR